MSTSETLRENGYPALFSIGHSNHPFDDLVALLKQHGVEIVTDVRTSPYSRYSPQFNSRDLRHGLKEMGIGYIFLGKELGGRPERDEFYDSGGYVDYGRVAETEVFQSGLERLLEGGKRFRVAMLCSEESPGECHRFLLVTRALYGRGVDVAHIRGDGSLERSEDIPTFEGWSDPVHQERPLFGEEVKSSWRSTRSASPRSRPRVSSRP